MPRMYFGTYGNQYEDTAEPANGNAGRYPLGQIMVLPDGREYRYGLCGATATVAANLYQGVAAVTNHLNQSADVARAIGATAVSATIGATAAAIDIYSEGLVHVNAGASAGLGYAYRIRRAIENGQAHAAAAGSDVLTVNLEPGESVRVALVVTTSKITFSRNRFHSVIIHPSPNTAQLAGVASGIITAAQYGWFQTKGPAAVLAQGTLIQGLSVMPSSSADGAVAAWALTEAAPNTEITPAVGHAIKIAADATYALIELALP